MRFFTKEEDEFLIKNRNKIPCKRMATMIGRSEGSARQRLKLLGKLPSREATERFKKESQIKKGAVPPNKGKKMPKEVYEKASKTFFTKGHKPHNTKYDGFERISKDGYIEIRIREGKFMLKHRYLWQQVYGKIPAGALVKFKDGNKQNVVIENLYLSSKVDNMKANTYHNYPEPIAKTIQLRGALNRQINKRIKQLENEK